MRKLTLSLALLMSALTAFAAETVLIDGLYYSLGTTTASVIKDQSSDKSVYSAYTSVTIPASVTYIDDYAFSGSALTSMSKVPSSSSWAT